MFQASQRQMSESLSRHRQQTGGVLVQSEQVRVLSLSYQPDILKRLVIENNVDTRWLAGKAQKLLH